MGQFRIIATALAMALIVSACERKPESKEATALPPTPAPPATTTAAVATTTTTTTRATTEAAPAATIPTSLPATTQSASTEPSTAPATTQAAEEQPKPIDLLASLKLPDAIVAGEWSMQDGVLVCNGKPGKQRARLRLAAAPTSEYDLAIKFTCSGDKPYFAQILTFNNRTFIWTMTSSQSGFGMINGKNTRSNATTVKKTIASHTAYTSVVKVRKDCVVRVLVPPKLSLPDTFPVIRDAVAIAKHVLANVPETNSEAADARALIAGPQDATRQFRKRQLDEFLAALPPVRSRSGVWTVRAPGEAATTDPDQIDLAANSSTAGHMTLTIDSRPLSGDEIAATLTNPDAAGVRQKFTGRLQIDSSSPRMLLVLRTAQSAAATQRTRTDADLKLPTSWFTLTLDPRGDRLIGSAEAGGSHLYNLDIIFDPPLPKK